MNASSSPPRNPIHEIVTVAAYLHDADDTDAIPLNCVALGNDGDRRAAQTTDEIGEQTNRPSLWQPRAQAVVIAAIFEQAGPRTDRTPEQNQPLAHCRKKPDEPTCRVGRHRHAGRNEQKLAVAIPGLSTIGPNLRGIRVDTQPPAHKRDRLTVNPLH